MSNYRRLISYIYAYEGGVKGKNIGFAKIEVRGEQCRIYVSVKKIYVGSNDIGVYLLAPSDEILLGRIFVRGGTGEFRMNVSSSDIEGSGCPMEACYGLTIHDVESTWQCYTTIWEDAVTQAAEMTLADVTSEKVRMDGETSQQAEVMTRKRAEMTQPGTESSRTEAPGKVGVPGESVLSVPVSELKISEEIERELEAEEQKMEAVAPWDGGGEEEGDSELGTGVEVALEEESMSGEISAQKITTSEVATESLLLPEPGDTPVSENTTEPEHAPVSENAPEPENVPEPEKTSALKIMASEPATESLLPPEPEDTAKLQELDRQEQEELSRNHLWNRLQRRYTKVLAFDYDNGCEILSIKPQDIGLLPRDIWVYGNNSFLLHGYYNYRHLILAKLDNPKGDPRYLLGVPGHYFSNEKYMASMFGFPHFVLARRQPENDGRFGYWYTDIRL